MAVTICHASIDERGKANSGAAGDQTGKEVCTRAWYSKPWNVMLRYKDASIAKKVAAIAKKLANSNLVGYDQYQRNTLYQALKSCGWDVDKYIKSGKKTETDCSAFMYTCYCCLVSSMRSDGNAPTTSTMQSFYTKHGFTAYTDSKYLTTDANLKVGDVLVKASSHTVMAITAGSNVSSGTTTANAGSSSSSSGSTSSKLQVAKKKSDKIKGSYEVIASDGLNIRLGAGVNFSKVGTIPHGGKVTSYGYYNTASNGVKWYLVVYGKITGYVSSQYLKKV